MSAILTRYYHSIYRDQSHSALKQAALEYWDNPQLKSQQNKWHQYVSEPVAAMVRGWLAKQDLMHFFELLRGNGDVDQARLHYWLRLPIRWDLLVSSWGRMPGKIVVAIL